MGFRLQEVPGVQAQGREGMGMVGGGRCYVAQSLTLGRGESSGDDGVMVAQHVLNPMELCT